MPRHSGTTDPMHARAFRFDAFRAIPRKPRSPLLRVLLGLLGLVLLAVLLFFGLFIGLAMLAAGLGWRLLHRRNAHDGSRSDAHGGQVVDAEYRVIERAELPTPR